MENGIPNYLKPYITITKAPRSLKEEFSVAGNIRCTCGSESFVIMREKWIQSKESKEAVQKINMLYGKYRKNALFTNGTLCETSTKDGKWSIAYITYDNGENIKILEDITELRDIANSTPLIPTFFEAICSHCGKKILIFDSSKYGYDGILGSLKNDFSRDYKTIKKNKCRKCGSEASKISVIISSTGKDDLFAESSELINDSNWEDAFDWITVNLKCSNCNKETKKYLDLETM